MPELPEVETVRRGLAAALEGRVLAWVRAFRPDLRRPLPPNFSERLTGRRVKRLWRRAKYLLVEMDDGLVLIVHLGMSGRMTVGRPTAGVLDAHDHVAFVTDDGTQVTFRDPRRFGLMTFCDRDSWPGHPLLRDLGPEPLDEAFTGAALAARLAGRRSPLKTALMDQRVVAGIGNIYACESLYRAGLSPRRRADTVSGARADRLAAAIKAVLSEAVAAGGSTLRDHQQPSGELGYFQHRFAVYGREGQPCPACVPGSSCGGIRRIVQAGRSTFFCAKRQR
ncbi:MAG: bifunctional DNA-formamidopyrimidine glycosylase/DNA-(apurinic or apyrimidinic site) lyase [Rhodospirillales bacterium]|nr:bifunctional DNA-formamidopyrimidine glycosylase/DNA-(apurinic or apyrimidinic site) lyase [Rhodospirillales bacterium]